MVARYSIVNAGMLLSSIPTTFTTIYRPVATSAAYSTTESSLSVPTTTPAATTTVVLVFDGCSGNVACATPTGSVEPIVTRSGVAIAVAANNDDAKWHVDINNTTITVCDVSTEAATDDCASQELAGVSEPAPATATSEETSLSKRGCKNKKKKLALALGLGLGLGIPIPAGTGGLIYKALQSVRTNNVLDIPYDPFKVTKSTLPDGWDTLTDPAAPPEVPEPPSTEPELPPTEPALPPAEPELPPTEPDLAPEAPVESSATEEPPVPESAPAEPPVSPPRLPDVDTPQIETPDTEPVRPEGPGISNPPDDVGQNIQGTTQGIEDEGINNGIDEISAHSDSIGESSGGSHSSSDESRDQSDSENEDKGETAEQHELSPTEPKAAPEVPAEQPVEDSPISEPPAIEEAPVARPPAIDSPPSPPSLPNIEVEPPKPADHDSSNPPDDTDQNIHDTTQGIEDAAQVGNDESDPQNENKDEAVEEHELEQKAEEERRRKEEEQRRQREEAEEHEREEEEKRQREETEKEEARHPELQSQTQPEPEQSYSIRQIRNQEKVDSAIDEILYTEVKPNIRSLLEQRIGSFHPGGSSSENLAQEVVDALGNDIKANPDYVVGTAMDDVLSEAPLYREDGSTSSYTDMKTAAHNGLTEIAGESQSGFETGLDAALEGGATAKEAIEAGVQAAKEISADLEGSYQEIVAENQLMDIENLANVQDYNNLGVLDEVIQLVEPASTDSSASNPSLQDDFFKRLDHDISAIKELHQGLLPNTKLPGAPRPFDPKDPLKYKDSETRELLVNAARNRARFRAERRAHQRSADYEVHEPVIQPHPVDDGLRAHRPQVPEGNFEGLLDANQEASAHALEHTDLVTHEIERIGPYVEEKLSQAGTSEPELAQVKEILPDVTDQLIKQVGEETDPGSWVSAEERLTLEVMEGIRDAGHTAIEQGASSEDAVDSAIQGGKDALSDLAMEKVLDFEAGFTTAIKAGSEPMNAVALGMESTELSGRPMTIAQRGWEQDLAHRDKAILMETEQGTVTDALEIIKEESKPISEIDKSATAGKRNKISDVLEKFERLSQESKPSNPRAGKEKLRTIDRHRKIPEHVRHEVDIMEHGRSTQKYEDIFTFEVSDEGPSNGANDLDVSRSASSQPLDFGDNNLHDHFYEYSRNFDYDAAIKHWQKQNTYASSARERFHAARVSNKLLQQREQLNVWKGWCNDVQRTHPELSWPPTQEDFQAVSNELVERNRYGDSSVPMRALNAAHKQV